MTHIANQRIKLGGTYYGPGDPITLTESDFADLPEGAVTLSDGQAELTDVLSLPDAHMEALRAAVVKLEPSAFKQDGDIRAGALKHLNETLDFDVTAEAVATVKAAIAAAGV